MVCDQFKRFLSTAFPCYLTADGCGEQPLSKVPCFDPKALSTRGFNSHMVAHTAAPTTSAKNHRALPPIILLIRLGFARSYCHRQPPASRQLAGEARSNVAKLSSLTVDSCFSEAFKLYPFPCFCAHLSSGAPLTHASIYPLDSIRRVYGLDLLSLGQRVVGARPLLSVAADSKHWGRW